MTEKQPILAGIGSLPTEPVPCYTNAMSKRLPLAEKAHKCIVCGERIPIERVYAALSRGRMPKFDCNRCRETHNKRMTRARQREALA